ncbi:nucleotidyltransferase domain-containing protein [Arthrobacter sp. 35W]|uniref:nucleotidyltransferase domain-containing protein n=1 Tax=Arthrobacter sp. 35W TaxID=1132441 RepID=UPI000423AD97|nr:nucleotidyltransferase [Arthrobacter sp. 35W]
MSIEATLSGWVGPSSVTEQDKQDRTERMIRDAINSHPAFADCDLKIYAKGSYANNTNVRTDSDVDIAVQCMNVIYWDEATAGAHPVSSSYTGIWTPSQLRGELVKALKEKFPDHTDDSGSTAIRINSSSARVEADVVPAFDYKYYFKDGSSRRGSRVFKKDGSKIANYPDQQLANGKSKNVATMHRYKKAVRVMKRVENAMVSAGHHREVQSFFVESLVYNCPNNVLMQNSWTDTIKGVIVHIWDTLEGDEPTDASKRWLEPNECKYLFYNAQPWSRQDGRDFAKAAWNYLGFST